MERILIVEDDAALAQGLCMTLEQYDCTAAPTLALARQALQEGGWDLVILDVNLPDGSGLELLREQKSIHPEVSAILLTANDLELDEVTPIWRTGVNAA